MPEKKLKLVYDCTVLREGLRRGSGRSGIFFTALNILKELVKREDVDLVLSCDGSNFHFIKSVIDWELPNIEFNFKTNKLLFYYSKIKFAKRLASEQGSYLKKIFLQIFLLITAPVLKLWAKFQPKDKLEGCDAFLSPCYVIHSEVKARKYTILYDVIPVKLAEYRKAYKKGNWFYKLCQTLNHNDNYFTISECTRRDFLKFYPQIDPKKITTTLLACDEHFRPSDSRSIEEVKDKYGISSNKKYVFSLCTLEPRKNLQRATKTFIEFLKKNNITDMVFVLGGGHWKSFIAKLESTISDLGEYKDKIIKAGYIADEDLPALYSGAEWFTYTSSYEGFGLPPLEAMSCGCPVITSNNSSLPEVVGDAGILIDWDSDQQHIEAYEKYYFDPQLRKINREKGLARSKEFSWTKCVDMMIEQMKQDMAGAL